MFKSILKPPQSVGMSVASVGIVIAIHAMLVPNGATVQATQAYDHNIESNRAKALWMETAAILALTLLTKDMNIFILGGGTTIALDWHDRHALSLHPATGQVVTYSQEVPPLTAVG